jgi:AraC-like DNA-binding protein
MFERLDSQDDALAQVLAAVHLGGALSARNVLPAPWAMHFDAADRRAEFHVVADGSCWVTLDQGGAPVRLGPGDVVLFPQGAAHTLGDAPETPAIEFADLVAGVTPGERVGFPWKGNGPSTTLLCGSYSHTGDSANPLLRGLPGVLHVPAVDGQGGRLGATIGLLAEEAESAEHGSAVVVDRLVDLLFVYTLRAWLEQQDAGPAPSWFAALHDPIVGPALRGIHEDPAREWTVAALAQRSGLSRAPFSRRFRELVGEPPFAYVTRWRMMRAADLLVAGERVSGVARQVGYDNEFAFAKAFKRVRGVAPGHFRRTATQAG